MSNATATYTIEFAGFAPASADATGYNAHDYLPGYDTQEFATREEAQAWIDANHAGPDCEGVTALFQIG